MKAAEGEVTPQTRAAVDAYRLCALHRSRANDVSREALALSAEWALREPSTVAWLQLCLGRKDDALKTWRAALANPQVRTDAVQFIQAREDIGPDSDFARELRAAEASLAEDPGLQAAFRPYGARLGWTLRQIAPKETIPQSR